MNTGIYRVRHIASGKQYVGSAVFISRRWALHRHELRHGKHHSEKLQRAWDKYGESAFVFETMLYCERSNLLMYEQLMIDGCRAASEGYNQRPTAGSWLGMKHSPESIKKISAAGIGRKNQYAKGAVMSQATKDKISALAKGRKCSDEAREKLRIARVGKTPALGMKHSDAAKAKMRARIYTPEARAKMSAARLGKLRGPYLKKPSFNPEED